jgi:RNA polymerase sigma factor (sigma-70 family)
LTKEQEQFVAKSYNDAEQHKVTLTKEWLMLYRNILKNNTIQKAANQTDKSSDFQNLAAVIDYVFSSNNEMKTLEKIINERKSSYSTRKKWARKKSEMYIEQYKRIKQIDLLKLYRTGTVNKLYPYVQKNIRRKHTKELLCILKAYLRANRTSLMAKNTLIQANLRLVVSIAKKYINRGMPFSDLMQEGNIGLIKAIERFDYRLNNRLSTYACWWIRQTIIRSIEDKASIIRVPVYLNDQCKKFKKNDPDYENTENADMIYSVLQLKDPLSLETPYGEDGSTLHECIPDTIPSSPLENISGNQLFHVTDEILKDLAPRDERVLRLRYGVGNDNEHTLEEIAGIFGLSRERIRQIETTALKKIKMSPHSTTLLPFIMQ